jgi:hypothetical protein
LRDGELLAPINIEQPKEKNVIEMNNQVSDDHRPPYHILVDAASIALLGKRKGIDGVEKIDTFLKRRHADAQRALAAISTQGIYAEMAVALFSHEIVLDDTIYAALTEARKPNGVPYTETENRQRVTRWEAKGIVRIVPNALDVIAQRWCEDPEHTFILTNRQFPDIMVEVPGSEQKFEIRGKCIAVALVGKAFSLSAWGATLPTGMIHRFLDNPAKKQKRTFAARKRARTSARMNELYGNTGMSDDPYFDAQFLD